MKKIQLWQLFDEHGQPIPTNGSTKQEVAIRGLLHGSAHVWMWRQSDDTVELLLQKRAAGKVNWPNMFDKSAGGHIALGETPLDAALRRTRYELGLEMQADDLWLAGVHRWYTIFGEEGLTENEFQFVYLVQVDHIKPHPAVKEVQGTQWLSLDELKKLTIATAPSDAYVPYGASYYLMLTEAATCAAGMPH